MKDEDWKIFTDAWLTAMRDFQSEKLTMEQAYELIERFSNNIDGEIEQFACNVVSEIGGSPGAYADTLALLHRQPSMHDVLCFMNS